MLILTDQKTLLNLDRFDAIQLVSKSSYYRTVHTISALIFDGIGDVKIEEPVRTFISKVGTSSKEDENAYLDGIEKDTSYVTISTKKQRDRMMLNVARFDVFKIESFGARGNLIAGKSMEMKRGTAKEKSVIQAVRFDDGGDMLKTFRVGGWETEEEAVAQLKKFRT